jgi:hypothetical protein
MRGEAAEVHRAVVPAQSGRFCCPFLFYASSGSPVSIAAEDISFKMAAIHLKHFTWQVQHKSSVLPLDTHRINLTLFLWPTAVGRLLMHSISKRLSPWEKSGGRTNGFLIKTPGFIRNVLQPNINGYCTQSCYSASQGCHNTPPQNTSPSPHPFSSWPCRVELHDHLHGDNANGGTCPLITVYIFYVLVTRSSSQITTLLLYLRRLFFTPLPYFLPTVLANTVDTNALLSHWSFQFFLIGYFNGKTIL